MRKIQGIGSSIVVRRHSWVVKSMLDRKERVQKGHIWGLKLILVYKLLRS